MGNGFIANGCTHCTPLLAGKGKQTVYPSAQRFRGRDHSLSLTFTEWRNQNLKSACRRALAHVAPSTWQALPQLAPISMTGFALPSEGSQAPIRLDTPVPTPALRSANRANCDELMSIFPLKREFPGGKGLIYPLSSCSFIAQHTAWHMGRVQHKRGVTKKYGDGQCCCQGPCDRKAGSSAWEVARRTSAAASDKVSLFGAARRS